LAYGSAGSSGDFVGSSNAVPAGKDTTMRKSSLFVLTTAMLTASSVFGGASAQLAAAANFAGTYRCAPEPSSCKNSGQTFTVTQSGNVLDLKSSDGDVGRANLTSNTTLSVGGPWNMLGTVVPDGRIQWSNGTVWSKQ
jgi:hypothetical protein